MHRAFALDHVKSLVGIMAVHVVFVAGLGVNMQPGMESLRVKNPFSLLVLVRHLDQIINFNWHSPSAIVDSA